ncbi:MAG: DUF4296 domain-containing protein [Bacteroidia bacterium]
MLTLFSCRQSETIQAAPPADLLSRKQMSSILVDLHLSEAMVNATNEVNDSFIQLSVNRNAAIYKKHGVQEENFRTSFEYYKLQPMEIDSIYTDIIQQLIDIQVKQSSGSFNRNSFKHDTLSQNR